MKLVENYMQTLWKSATVHVSAFWALIIAYFMANPAQWEEVQQIIPEDWRPFARICISFFMFASTAGARVVSQKNMSKPEEPKP